MRTVVTGIKAVQDMHSELIFVGVFYQISVLVLTQYIQINLG
jgi:hypothetical protein